MRPVSVQCRVLRVSVAGYHAHLVRRASSAQRRHLSDEALLVHIKALYAETRGAYGWPRIWRELVARGIPVGKDRVQKLMQLHGVKARGKRRFKVTTDSRHELPISANLLNREFTVAEPDSGYCRVASSNQRASSTEPTPGASGRYRTSAQATRKQ